MSKSGQTPLKGPKVMSSRLANMKFMQRAAATPLPPSPSPGTPLAENERSGKKAKTLHGQETSLRESSTAFTKDEESTKPLGVSGAETKWSLGWAGQVAAPSSDSDEENAELAPWSHGGSSKGRLQFGGFKRKPEKVTIPTGDDNEEGDIADGGSNSGSEASSGDEAGQFVKQNMAQIREVRARHPRAERDRPRKVIGGRKRKDGKVGQNKPGGRQGISSNAR